MHIKGQGLYGFHGLYWDTLTEDVTERRTNFITDVV